ncbi:MAG TPA: PDZ domain-containing protein [Streptosporangiaceae bacterium]
MADSDVWLAPLSQTGTARAWRLTADRAKAANPRFSHDGAHLAWTSWRDGNPEVYLTDVEGTSSTRLTYWGDDRTTVTGWTEGGEVLAITAAGQPGAHHSWAYAIPLGGTPRRLPYGPVNGLAMRSARTALLTGRFAREPAYWKRYRGGTAGKLWTATSDDPLFTRILADLSGQYSNPMLIDDRLVFMSDHEGTGNIYSCRLDGGDLSRHTDHDGFYARNPSTDGRRIVYHVAGDIWILDGLDAEPVKLDIALGAPAAARMPRMISAADHLGYLDCDQTGQASAIEVRGTVHWLAHKDGPARTLYVSRTARARFPTVLGGTGRVAYITDEAGPDAIAIVGVDGPEDTSPRLIATGELGSVISLAASGDGATLAAAAHDGKLYAVDVESGGVTEVAAGQDGPVDGLAWSPDSEWLAWSEPVPQQLRRIRVARLGTGEVVDLTDGRFADTDPVFTLDGLYLAFLSRRSFDPVYDTQSFALSFPYGARPYLAPLAARTPSPFAPLPGGRPVTAEEKSDNDERPVVALDPDGLPSRVVAVPVAEGRYSGLRAVKGGLAWLREELAGVLGESAADPDGPTPRPALEWFDLAKRECAELVDELDWFDVSGDGTRLVVRDKGDLRVIPFQSKHDSSDAAVTVDLERARFLADPAALWRHAYGEAGRLMRRDYWVADMSGVDWDGVLDAYRPLLDRIRTSDDFNDLMWEVFGELGTSHAYARPANDSYDWPDRAVGLLGADIAQDESGRWVVVRVLPGESSDPKARSPLAAPGVAVRPGDAILAVDGQPVDPVLGPWPLLGGLAGKPVELTIAPAEGETRRVAVVPMRSERRLRYQDWVAGRRQLVRELSDGRLGYLHIPDMMGEGWAHFSRDLRVEIRREGLVMDVRGNGGGHISELVVAKLAPNVIAWDVARWYQPVSYPIDGRRGPLVTLADEFAGSDGDIVTAAIHSLGLGPVVGARTWGGVIGYIEPHELVDGTRITIPQLAFAFDDYGWEVENYGVDPDVEVLISPDDWAAGHDPQLEIAVRLALEALDKQGPATRPDPSTAPRKTRPPLPPRSR